jgi:hypothetical protein
MPRNIDPQGKQSILASACRKYLSAPDVSIKLDLSYYDIEAKMHTLW